jgi:hypothetical protein
MLVCITERTMAHCGQSKRFARNDGRHGKGARYRQNGAMIVQARLFAFTL